MWGRASQIVFKHSKNFSSSKIVLKDAKVDNSQVNRWSCPDGHRTEISIYSALTKNLEPLILKDKGVVKWYSCGPTVYDTAHIGHACCYMRFDIIRRILENFFNLKVFYVMGITNIDDKIIIRSKTLKENHAALSKRYEIEFFSDLAKLSILPPNAVARVTDHIPEIVHFISEIVQSGLAYPTPDGSVYFDTQQYGKYGKFYATSEENVSEANSPFKKHPLDFALWKGSKPDEPFWDTPWGKGRPGWHIECSAMASKYFGSQVDIHSGGIDLFYPHHEDEEAQCCAYHGVSQWVNYWIHSGHLFLKNTVKMSKSLQNSVTVDQFLEEHSANDFRFICLLSRYRNNVEYDADVLVKAIALRKKFGIFLENTFGYISNFQNQGSIDEPKLLQTLQETEDSVRSALANDFNTTLAMSLLTDLVSLTNSMMQGEANVHDGNKGSVAVAHVSNFVKRTLSLLGVNFEPDQARNDSAHLIEEILSASVQFRSQIRNRTIAAMRQKEILEPKEEFKTLLQICDKFRDDLSTAGIVIKDQKDKSIWSFDADK